MLGETEGSKEQFELMERLGLKELVLEVTHSLNLLVVSREPILAIPVS